MFSEKPYFAIHKHDFLCFFFIFNTTNFGREFSVFFIFAYVRSFALLIIKGCYSG